MLSHPVITHEFSTLLYIFKVAFLVWKVSVKRTKHAHQNWMNVEWKNRTNDFNNKNYCRRPNRFIWLSMSGPSTPPASRAKSKKMSAVITSGHGGTSSQPTGLIGSSLVAQRKGASMVGLRLADLNQHLCTAMFGVVLGECHPPCSISEKVQAILKLKFGNQGLTFWVFLHKEKMIS